MSGRYRKLFSLSQNLYCADSPIIIVAGALQKDTKTEKIYAQLKLKNISRQKIKALSIKICLSDTASRHLSNTVEYQYLDIKISSGQTFGEQTLIPVGENSARSFTVSVTEIIFEDQSICGPLTGPWVPLPPPVLVKQMVDDPELLKQYKIKFGKHAVYQFAEVEDLWRCSCGTWNRKDDFEECLNCGISYADLASLDLEELKAKKDIRLAQEAVKTAQRKEARKAKEARRKRIFISSVVLVLIVFFTVVAISTYNSYKHDKMIDEYEKMIVGKWSSTSSPSKIPFLLIEEDGAISFDIWQNIGKTKSRGTYRIEFEGTYEYSGEYTSKVIDNITTSFLLKSDVGSLILYLCDDGRLALIPKVNGIVYDPVFFTRA